MGIKSYEELEVYQIGYKLALEIHQLTKTFPQHEMYELGSQLRRAAISVVLNIVEGYGRQSKAEFKRFLGYSLGSANEVIVLLKMAKDLGYIDKKDYLEQYDVLGKRLYKLKMVWK